MPFKKKNNIKLFFIDVNNWLAAIYTMTKFYYFMEFENEYTDSKEN